MHQKPIGLLNTNGFFDALLAWVDRAVADGFVKEKYCRLIVVETEVDKLLYQIFSEQ